MPDNVFVRCPLVEFRLRSVQRCADCQKNAGVEDLYPGMDRIAFAKRYRIRCAHPQARDLFEIATETTE